MSQLILLLPERNRNLLESLISFCSDICARTNTRNGWARQISTAMGPTTLLPPQRNKPKKGGYDPSVFAASFFELLMQCHGIYTHTQQGEREIWTVPESIIDKLKVTRTPRRICRSATPRKKMGRLSFGSQSVKRNLFKSFETRGAEIRFVRMGDGKNFYDVVGGDEVDREKFSKRLKMM